jgi:cupin fold WbuC family metalloprotein
VTYQATSNNTRVSASEAKLIAAGDLREVVAGVYYSPYPLPLLDSSVIEILKHAARKSPVRRARFCAHLSPEAEQHDMLVVTHQDSYVTPHRHLTKSETFVVLQGSADVILFDEGGAVKKIIRMGAPSSGLPFFYRMPPKRFHSLAIETEFLVFLENTKGPFISDDREHATWAPNFDDAERGKAFIASALQRAVTD